MRHVRLTPAQAGEVAARIERFATDEDPGDPGGPDERGDPHGLLFCLYRANIPTLPAHPAG
jgi:hypothetical protein